MTALLSMYERVASWLYSEKEQLKSEKGQTTIEYILVLVLIVLVLVYAFKEGVVADAIGVASERIADALATDPSGSPTPTPPPLD